MYERNFLREFTTIFVQNLFRFRIDRNVHGNYYSAFWADCEGLRPPLTLSSTVRSSKTFCFGSESIETFTGRIVPGFEPIVKISGRLWHFDRPHGVPKLSFRFRIDRNVHGNYYSAFWADCEGLRPPMTLSSTARNSKTFCFGPESIETFTRTIRFSI